MANFLSDIQKAIVARAISDEMKKICSEMIPEGSEFEFDFLARFQGTGKRGKAFEAKATSSIDYKLLFALFANSVNEATLNSLLDRYTSIQTVKKTISEEEAKALIPTLKPETEAALQRVTESAGKRRVEGRITTKIVVESVTSNINWIKEGDKQE